MATFGCSTSVGPTSAPKPVTVLTTPSGKPASFTSSISASVEQEVNSDGLMTTVLPAASAGASFQERSIRGEFHGVIADHDAERLALGVDEHVRLVDRRHPALDLVREAAEVVEPLRDVAELRRHLGVELAVVARLDRRELLGIPGDQLAQAPQELAAGGGVHPRPGALGEGPPGGLDRGVGVLGAAARHLGPVLPRVGVGRGEPPAGRAVARAAVDDVPEAHGGLPPLGGPGQI